MSSSLHRYPASTKVLSFTPRATLKEKMGLIDDFGLISSGLNTFKPHFGREKTRNVNTIKLADFWGENSAKKIIKKENLSRAAQKLKHEYWKGDIKSKELGHSPVIPQRLGNFATCASNIINKEEKKSFRVLSPQNQMDVGKEITNSGRLGVINSIIQSCIDCGVNDIKIDKEVNSVRRGVKRLTRTEKMNIENNIRALDYQLSL